MKKILAALFILVAPQCFGAWTIHFSNNFSSDEDDVDNFSYSKMDNSLFVGAALSTGGKLYVGWTYMMFSRSYKSDDVATEEEVSTTEMGPRFLLYFNEKKTVFLSTTWLPFAKGERKRAGNTEDIDGSALHFALGYQVRLAKKFMLGASIGYHSLSINEVIDSSNNKTEPAQSYTSILPMIDFSFHFK